MAMTALHFLWPGVVIFLVPWNLFGLIPLTTGIILNLVADGAFHKAGTAVKPLEESTVLLTSGVFRISRNPMYLGFALVLAGVALLLGSLTPWVAVPAFVLVTDRLYIAVEERMLEARFGPAWKEYTAKVRCWI